jgi:hypothetical protein
VTHHPAAYHPQIARRRLTALLVLAAVPLAACGGAKSTLPPAPARADNVAIHNLAHDPEVYADATVATVGSVARANGPQGPLYQLLGGHGKRIVLEPTAKAARYLGHRVRASGIFTATFALGYEILISRITPIGTL